MAQAPKGGAANRKRPGHDGGGPSGKPAREAPRDGDGEGFSDADEADIQESSRLSALQIYEILRREGEEEMDRPATSLWWSGLAAGLSISFSLVAQGVLKTHLPDRPWSDLVTGFGYTVGFLIVVTARHQLFTENTITAVLPVAARLSFLNLARMGRLWGIVLFANLVATLLAALFFTYTPVIPADLRQAMLTISQASIFHPPAEIFFKAIAAGFLIAAMVWLLPSANAAQFQVIVVMTYLIAVGGFAHIIAGSCEGFMLVVNGRLEITRMVVGFALPALVGNIVGGTVLFSMIAYGQVAKEM